jgi:hypothetical protein
MASLYRGNSSKIMEWDERTEGRQQMTRASNGVDYKEGNGERRIIQSFRSVCHRESEEPAQCLVRSIGGLAIHNPSGPYTCRASEDK